jgi:exopolyphosphatase/guanosine-5'-triphosphate,3'-diphosphate pyrophosphatase
MRTTENLARKHNVDLNHAEKVRLQADSFLKQLNSSLNINKNDELASLLGWGALLHEVGLSISYQGFHRHSSYILQYTNMPGFNQEQQLVVSALVRFQRKSLKISELVDFSLFKKKNIIQLIRILRLSILLNGQRNDDKLPVLRLDIDSENTAYWAISSDDKYWLENNTLLHADLVIEREYWHKAGWQLTF